MIRESNKKTLVFGASLRPERVSNMVIYRLLDNAHEVVAIGGRKGEIEEVEVQTGQPGIEDIHTITMYMGERRQQDHEDYLVSLNPKRIIFNPGAENPDFAFRARSMGIETLNACTFSTRTSGNLLNLSTVLCGLGTIPLSRD